MRCIFPSVIVTCLNHHIVAVKCFDSLNMIFESLCTVLDSTNLIVGVDNRTDIAKRNLFVGNEVFKVRFESCRKIGDLIGSNNCFIKT